jgi:hypothetical protein
MKNLLCVLLTTGVIALMSCEKERNLNIFSIKWTMGELGKKDTTLSFKPQATGDLRFKVNNYSLCPTHIIGLTININGKNVLQTSVSKKDSLERKIPVKRDDDVIVQTKLVETGAKIACFTLGKAECEITE